jgi:phosphate:Na+ symporter
LETLVSIVGGVGLFLLGMAVMTDGLKALAGTALKTVMEKAAATPLLGTFWGAVITLIVQSSSATTMTTIGLVSAGLLTFPQGLSLVFGANIGTTGTGWLVAAFGVRISLTAAALPIVFVGALLKVVGRGRLAAAGSAIAGFALILVGLSTLQQGMGGLAQSLHPSDLPTITNAAGAINLAGMANVLLLVVVGALMTTVMQSSTAAIAVTLSALYAGAVGLDQALALVIGQNIGTATSSAVAAIGASSTAKRLAVAYIAFKLVAALIAIVLFPFVTPLIVRASQTIDSTGLLAAYHTAYNVIGVAVLLPLMGPFTRLIERFVPERGSPSRNTSTRLRCVRRWSRSRRCAARSSGRLKRCVLRRRPGSKAPPWAPLFARSSMTRHVLRRRMASAPRAIFCRKAIRRLPTTAMLGSPAQCTRSIMRTGSPKRSTPWRKRVS